MECSVKFFNGEEKGGFKGPDLIVPLCVVQGSKIHRSFVGTCIVDESDTRVFESDNGLRVIQIAQAEGRKGLKTTTTRSYEQLLNTVSHLRLQLLRIWNFIPRVLEEDQGIERYRLFNTGRHDVVQRHSNHPLPAATGIGSLHGPLIIEALATENNVTHLENPLQKQPITYSKQYGEHPPVFARGTFHHAMNPELYIAGTAAIRGEKTVHSTDIVRQMETTIENIRRLIDDANLRHHALPLSGFSLGDIHDIRIFVKHVGQYPAVRRIAERVWGNQKSIMYILDDICRPDLLVEIEGKARKA